MRDDLKKTVEYATFLYCADNIGTHAMYDGYTHIIILVKRPSHSSKFDRNTQPKQHRPKAPPPVT